MAYSYNGVTIEQIRRRFFPTTSHNAYYRRVHKLIQAQYLQVRRAWSLSRATARRCAAWAGVIRCRRVATR